MNILITEPKDYSPAAIKTYKTLGRVYFLPNLKRKERKEILGKIEILVVRLGLDINKRFVDKLPKLKIIASPTTGLNHIDLDYARSKGIKVISLRGRKGFLRHIPSTAEEALGLMIALVRKFPWAFDDVKRGNWDRDKFKGYQFAGKTSGIFGYGRLGKIMAKYIKALGMKVQAYDPYVERKTMLKDNVSKVSLDILFKTSDVISIHALLTPETENFIQEKHLKLMKPSAYLINTARAEIINQRDFLKSLSQRRIAGAALDVLWEEKGDGSHLKNSELLEYAKKNSNLLIVPHLGGATYEAMHITEVYLANLVVKFFKKR